MRAAQVPLFGKVVHSFGSDRLSVAEHEYPVGLFAAPHFHDHSYLTLIVGGAIVERFSRTREELTTSDVQLMPAGERHSNEYVKPTRCVHLEVDTMLSEIGEVPPGRRRDPRTAFLSGLICDEVENSDDLSPVAIEGLLFALLAGSARSRKPIEGPAWLPRVIDLLHSSFTARLTLAELSALAGVHRAHLCREFHRRMGKTIGGYVRELRVAHACKLLRRSDGTLASIAVACGFSDQSHFSSAFRRSMRMTPGRYRRLTAAIR